MQLYFSNNEVVDEKHYIKYYNGFKEIYIIKGIKKGFEKAEKNKSSEEEKNKSSEEEKNRIEQSRIKSKIRDYALMNNFEYFYTQTINSNFDRFNLEEFKKLILRKFKAYKRINKNFKYLIIFEKHKNGAFHLHGLISDLGIDLHKNFNGYDTLEFFSDIGFNSISAINNHAAIANYICKYISKDVCKTLSGYSYFHSKGLLLPKVEKVFIDDFSALNLVFENKYMKKFKF